ncbi:hypothetical protein B0H21DRAFT_741794 [Amylocystis lapponica]|nr:hypothetical protein B0H21DRAFT_741794 [Amylocystis lapponica]
MAKVQAHLPRIRSLRVVALSPGFCRTFSILVLFVFLVCCYAHMVVAQSSNGGIGPDTFAIVASPMPHDVWKAGMAANISLNVANGNSAGNFDPIEMYLQSTSLSARYPISSQTGLIRHSWGTACGLFQLFVLHGNSDGSHVAVAAIPVIIHNQLQLEPCAFGTDELYVQPRRSHPRQLDAPHRRSADTSYSSSAWDHCTRDNCAAGPQLTIVLHPPHTTLPYAPSSSTKGAGNQTVSRNATSTGTAETSFRHSATVVLMSVETVVSTTTAPGSTVEITATRTVVSTTTIPMSIATPTLAGFVPVTAAASRSSLSRGLLPLAYISIVFFALRTFFTFT